MVRFRRGRALMVLAVLAGLLGLAGHLALAWWDEDRKSTRLNSSH